MIKEQQLLETALARHIITPEQFQQMSALIETSINRNPDERFRVVSGFSEIFISIGLLILFGALSGIFALIIPNGAVSACIMTAIAWVAASYFTERKRFLLPSIVASLYSAITMGSALWLMQNPTIEYLRAFDKLELWQVLLPLGATFITLCAAAWRFRIPFLMLPIGIMFAALVTVAGHAAGNSVSYRLLLAISGITILGVALRFDLKDPHRVRRASDFAFWCYVIGSPLTIHPLFISLLTEIKQIGVGISVFLIMLSAIISVIALMINRRALILSTLIYLGIAFFQLTSQMAGSKTGIVIFIPILLIGLYVVTLGTEWKRARSKLMHRMKWRPWFSKLPPF